MRAWSWLWAMFFLGISAFGGCGPTPDDDDDIAPDGDADADGDSDADCLDLDGDGAGIGDGCTANDCDDTDPATTSQCGEGCDARPERAGCPCAAGEVVACYMGPAGTGGVGVCQAGLKECDHGVWAGCEGQVLPQAGGEICDESDNDCNGQVDEGVQSDCGNCNFDCRQSCVGVGCDDAFNVEDGRSIIQNADGSITLSGAASVQNFVIWVANSQQGAVSRLDTRTREEIGRYKTASIAYPDPSRTTVNPRGDVVVSNRSPQGSSTKILASDCPDRNGNGVVDTSTGGDDVLAWNAGDDPEDECIVWNVDGIPYARGSAFEVRAELDGGLAEYVWVGSYNLSVDGTIFEIDSIAGEKTGVEIPVTGAYGLAVGPGGLLWSVGLGGCPVSTDTTTLEQTRYACPGGRGGAYGLAVDSEGRVWMGSTVARLDPVTETWELPVGQAWGAGITVDAAGNAYTGEGGTGYRIDAETMEVTNLPGMSGHGWAVDFDGFIWSIDMATNGAHVMDPETLEVENVVPPFQYPYTYSDMTGFQLQNTITPAGIYQRLFELCEADQQVEIAQLSYEASVPAGTQILFRLRHAESLDGIENAGWIDIGHLPGDDSPIDVAARLEAAGVTRLGHFIQIEATLQSVDRLNRPTLTSFAFNYRCGMIFE